MSALRARGLIADSLSGAEGVDLHMRKAFALADSAARRYVSGVAWHCYGGDVAAQETVHARHPDKDVYFTECSGGAWAPNFGINSRRT